MTYHVNNTYAKLAPDSILNKKIKEIMCYTGGHRTSPFTTVLLLRFLFFLKSSKTSLLVTTVTVTLGLSQSASPSLSDSLSFYRWNLLPQYLIKLLYPGKCVLGLKMPFESFAEAISSMFVSSLRVSSAIMFYDKQ